MGEVTVTPVRKRRLPHVFGTDDRLLPYSGATARGTQLLAQLVAMDDENGGKRWLTSSGHASAHQHHQLVPGNADDKEEGLGGSPFGGEEGGPELVAGLAAGTDGRRAKGRVRGLAWIRSSVGGSTAEQATRGTKTKGKAKGKTKGGKGGAGTGGHEGRGKTGGSSSKEGAFGPSASAFSADFSGVAYVKKRVISREGEACLLQLPLSPCIAHLNRASLYYLWLVTHR
jgi:hypothetical protein